MPWINTQQTVHKKLAKLLLCASTLWFSPAPSFAAESDPGLWAIFSTTNSFPSDSGANRWRYWFDAQARFFDLGDGVNQYLVRPGVGYDLNENVTAWLGYARFRTRGRNGGYADEDRFWQQLTWGAGEWAGGRITMRARLEQRSVSVGSDTGLELRFSTRYTRPIGANGQRDLVIGLEPFVSLKDTDWSGESRLAQNRFSVGIAWRLAQGTVLETAYMNQFLWRDGAEDISNHLAVAHLRVRF